MAHGSRLTALSSGMDPDPRPETPPADRVAVTRHRLRLGGEREYVAAAGTMVIAPEPKGKPAKATARLSFVSYALPPEPEASPRPVTFAFNGGPGSSSVWLHLGLLGPRRVVIGDAGESVGPPYRLADNEHTLLTHSDLVFIDPVSTGHSRALDGEDPAQFHGFEADIESVGEFVRLWLTRAGRWDSPVFLAGESYGTLRAAALARHLQSRHGLFLSGVMLISPILDYATVDMSPGHDLAYPLLLPTYAATAHYHGRVGGDLDGLLARARDFADGEYLRALHLGARLDADRFEAAATRLSELTGLSTDVVRRHDLRVPLGRFRKELLRGGHRVVGRLDTRFTGFDREHGGDAPEDDPSLTAITGPFTAAMQLQHRALGIREDLSYEILTDRVRPWSYAPFENRHLRVADDLRRAMHDNPHLRVHLASGIYDAATPIHALRHTVDHLSLAGHLRANLQERVYPAGHMMYVHGPSLARQGQDLRDFVAGTAT